MKELLPKHLSEIKVQYFIGNSRITDYYRILTIKYSGKYGFGSAGNGDAQYMYAKGEFGLNCYEPSAVILDFSQIEYEWGDLIEMVFSIGSNQYIDAEFPIALVIGKECSEAIGTLVHGIDSMESATTEEWIFDNFDLAWSFVEGKIEKRHTTY
ncbi:MAG: hypothetical protein ABJG68_16780 [Crocinitomicaceae bacterium]